MQCLNIIHSQEALVDIETGSFPYLKTSKDRNKILSKYEKEAHKLAQKEVLTVEQMIGKLNGGR